MKTGSSMNSTPPSKKPLNHVKDAIANGNDGAIIGNFNFENGKFGQAIVVAGRGSIDVQDSDSLRSACLHTRRISVRRMKIRARIANLPHIDRFNLCETFWIVRCDALYTKPLHFAHPSGIIYRPTPQRHTTSPNFIRKLQRD